MDPAQRSRRMTIDYPWRMQWQERTSNRDDACACANLNQLRHILGQALQQALAPTLRPERHRDRAMAAHARQDVRVRHTVVVHGHQLGRTPHNARVDHEARAGLAAAAATTKAEAAQVDGQEALRAADLRRGDGAPERVRAPELVQRGFERGCCSKESRVAHILRGWVGACTVLPDCMLYMCTVCACMHRCRVSDDRRACNGWSECQRQGDTLPALHGSAAAAGGRPATAQVLAPPPSPP